ncbi:hypothetical protein [Streptomyces sp. NPDC057579]|uniref:hypothetical protein n=1 Tax=Streptomyces sp. NPDC057579 TaxID=3346172 RepID=UPI00368CF6AD
MEKVGAQLVPADGNVVHEVARHGFQVPAEPVLKGSHEEGQVVAGHSVMVDVDARVTGDAVVGGLRGAGDEGSG